MYGMSGNVRADTQYVFILPQMKMYDNAQIMKVMIQNQKQRLYNFKTINIYKIIYFTIYMIASIIVEK